MNYELSQIEHILDEKQNIASNTEYLLMLLPIHLLSHSSPKITTTLTSNKTN